MTNRWCIAAAFALTSSATILPGTAQGEDGVTRRLIEKLERLEAALEAQDFVEETETENSRNGIVVQRSQYVGRTMFRRSMGKVRRETVTAWEDLGNGRTDLPLHAGVAAQSSPEPRWLFDLAKSLRAAHVTTTGPAGRRSVELRPRQWPDSAPMSRVVFDSSDLPVRVELLDPQGTITSEFRIIWNRQGRIRFPEETVIFIRSSDNVISKRTRYRRVTLNGRMAATLFTAP